MAGLELGLQDQVTAIPSAEVLDAAIAAHS